MRYLYLLLIVMMCGTALAEEYYEMNSGVTIDMTPPLAWYDDEDRMISYAYIYIDECNSKAIKIASNEPDNPYFLYDDELKFIAIVMNKIYLDKEPVDDFTWKVFLDVRECRPKSIQLIGYYLEDHEPY